MLSKLKTMSKLWGFGTLGDTDWVYKKLNSIDWAFFKHSSWNWVKKLKTLIHNPVKLLSEMKWSLFIDTQHIVDIWILMSFLAHEWSSRVDSIPHYKYWQLRSVTLTISIGPIIIEAMTNLLVNRTHRFHVGLSPLTAQVFCLHFQ